MVTAKISPMATCAAARTKDIAKDAHDGSAGIVHYPSAERGQLKRGNLEALDPKRNPHNCDAKEHPSHAPQNRSDNAASEYPD